MGNCASVCVGGQNATSSSAPRNLMSLQSIQEKEEILREITAQVERTPESEMFLISLKKFSLRSFFDATPLNSSLPLSEENKHHNKSLLNAILDTLQEQTKKTFVPISFMNDPSDSKLMMKVAFANSDVLNRYETEQWNGK